MLSPHVAARALAFAPVLVMAALAASCGDDQDPTRARDLYARVLAANYTQWEPPRNLPRAFTSNTRHADQSAVYENPTLAAAERGPAVIAWPDGSIVVKDGLSGGDKSLIAIMEKTNGEWFFAEYNASGESHYSGKPKVCLDCHGARSTYSDWLYALELPR